jgi:hypothetical protein
VQQIEKYKFILVNSLMYPLKPRNPVPFLHCKIGWLTSSGAVRTLCNTSVEDPDPGSGAFLTPWIRDGEKIKIRIRNPDPR